MKPGFVESENLRLGSRPLHLSFFLGVSVYQESNTLRRISSHNYSRWHIPCDNRTSPNYRTPPNIYARQNKCARADKGILANINWPHNQRKILLGKIVS